MIENYFSNSFDMADNNDIRLYHTVILLKKGVSFAILSFWINYQSQWLPQSWC